MYVIAYDITDDTTRGRLAAVLEGFGHRVQHSVFECELEENELEPLLKRLKAVLAEPEAGNIRVYRLCRDCMRHSQGIGRLAPPVGDGTCIIF